VVNACVTDTLILAYLNLSMIFLQLISSNVIKRFVKNGGSLHGSVPVIIYFKSCYKTTHTDSLNNAPLGRAHSNIIIISSHTPHEKEVRYNTKGLLLQK